MTYHRPHALAWYKNEVHKLSNWHDTTRDDWRFVEVCFKLGLSPSEAVEGLNQRRAFIQS